MICCNPLLVPRLARPHSALQPPTISKVFIITYLVFAPYFDILTFATTFNFFFLSLLSSENLTFSKSVISSVAILILLRRFDATTLTVGFSYFFLLFGKPCDFYSVAMVVSVVVRMLIVIIQILQW